MQTKDTYLRIGIIISGTVLLALLLVLGYFLTRKTKEFPDGSLGTPFSSPSVFLSPSPDPQITNAYSPADVQLIQEEQKNEAENSPDVTVSNLTPYQDENISIKTEYVPANPGYFKVIVSKKEGSTLDTKVAFETWLKNNGIPATSFKKLIVEYR